MAHRAQLSSLNQVPVPYHSHSLTPSSLTHVNKTAQPQRTSSHDSSSEGIRKRVGKACDRCRLKKSKCDGTSPCTRCKADNAVCQFGERKKSHDKTYPKGYVDVLETQQGQLVEAMVILYEKLRKSGAWEGPALESNQEGRPYTHYLLAALGVIKPKADGSTDEFEEDVVALEEKMLAKEAAMAHANRRGSFSSDSDLSLRSHARTQSQGTPMMAQHAPPFKEDFNFEPKSEPSSPSTHSVAARSNRHSFQALPAQPSPLQQSSPIEEDIMFQASWPQYDVANETKYALQPNYAIQAPSVQQHQMGLQGFERWDASDYTPDMDYEQFPSWQGAPVHNAYNNGILRPAGIDYPEMELDYNTFVAVQT